MSLVISVMKKKKYMILWERVTGVDGRTHFVWLGYQGRSIQRNDTKVKPKRYEVIQGKNVVRTL